MEEIFSMLCDFVRIAGVLYVVEERNVVKAVHDACQRLTEAINSIVGFVNFSTSVDFTF